MKIGRRPVYIMGLLLALVGSIMGAVQTQWGVWVAFNVFWVCPLTFGVNYVNDSLGHRLWSQRRTAPDLAAGYVFCASNWIESGILGAIV